MAKTFVAMNDRVQGILRECTRQSPLYAFGPHKVVQYRVRSENLPNAYYSLAAFHALQGFSVDETSLSRWRVQEEEKPLVACAAGFFDATQVDRRCVGDLRLKPSGQGPGMVAAELLTFGTGALRPAGYATADAWEFREYGRLNTPLEVTYARIAALWCGPWSSSRCMEREVYYSTNMIYGDALGEVEQLWERRADMEFLNDVAQHLQSMRHWSRAPAPTHAPLDYESVIKIHLRAQSIWRKPPATGRGLLRRLEFILEHTIIDSSPGTAFESPRQIRNPLTNPESTPEPDRSGYDGWLTDTGLSLN